MVSIQGGEDDSRIPLDNPPNVRHLHQLERDVEHFYTRDGLENFINLETLLKGAQIARNPEDLDTPNLSPAERNALEKEDSQWLSQTRDLSVTIMATACAAITQGWQQSTINASSLMGWDTELGLNDNNELLRGLINAAPWLSGSIIGTWLSDPLQERFFGRRPALFLAAIFCVACVIGTAHCSTWQELLICRLLLGFGIGSKASIAPVFAAEAAPDKHRGRVLMMWQLFDAFGIFMGFVCAFIVRNSWRVLLSTAMIPAVVLLFLIYLCPESPRFLIRQGKYSEAYSSLRHLRGTDIQAARDLYSIHCQLQAEIYTVWKEGSDQDWFSELVYQAWIGKMNFFKRMGKLFSNPRCRRACMVALIVMLSQQLCGINVVAFYSTDLFKSNSDQSDNTKIKWFNFGFGIANFLFTLPSYYFIDKKGRRPLLLVSFIGMAVSLFAVSGFFYITKEEVRIGLVATFTIVIFNFFYSIGAGPIPFTLSAEVFPLCVREVGMSFSVMINFAFLGLLVLFVPALTRKFGHDKVCGENVPKSGYPCNGQGNLLIFFSCLNILALIFIFLLVPDTNSVQLEAMNSIFNQHTKEHCVNHIRTLGLLPKRPPDWTIPRERGEMQEY